MLRNLVYNGYQCHNMLYRASRSRCYSALANANEFLENKDLQTRMPSLKNLPPSESAEPSHHKFTFDFNKSKNIYTEDKMFRQVFDAALQHVYNEKVTATTTREAQMKQFAWLKLRDYIYLQLQDPDLNAKIQRFRPTLAQLVQPTKPNEVLAQLAKAGEIDESVWEGLLKHGRPTTQIEKYSHVLDQIFDYIHGQEVVPLMTGTSKAEEFQEIDFTNPSEWFPEARKMKRHIIMHIGPTNSGKTFRALQKLKKADRGYYAGPLRLLAREVYDRFQEEGVRCNLLTGEEVIRDLDSAGNPAGITSGTVEMVPLTQKFDVVVLDEIQMMSDPDRGWAWSNALLGVRSREVHLCGEKSTLPVIEKIIKMTGDRLTVNEYERLGELKVESRPLSKGLKSLKKGDCIVAFSKKKILDLKLKIEKETNLKVAVIYGSLPPETRIQQASLFNSGECDVMVASDAIGMGLNLSIDRVIFTTNVKFNGKDLVDLTSSNIKQIGGRAGRFKAKSVGLDIPRGFISTLDSQVLSAVRKGIDAPIQYLDHVIIWPPDEICASIMTKFPPKTSPSVLLETIAGRLEQNSTKLFRLSDLKNRLTVLKIFQDMEDIPFFDKLRLSNAPVKDLPLVKRAFHHFCSTIAKRHTRGLLSYPLPFEVLDFKCIPDEKFNLELYESLYNIIMLFFWLGNRYPSYFIDIESAKDLKYFCELIIFEKLDRLKRNPYARKVPPSAANLYKKRHSLTNRHM